MRGVAVASTGGSSARTWLVVSKLTGGAPGLPTDPNDTLSVRGVKGCPLAVKAECNAGRPGAAMVSRGVRGQGADEERFMGDRPERHSNFSQSQCSVPRVAAEKDCNFAWRPWTPPGGRTMAVARS